MDNPSQSITSPSLHDYYHVSLSSFFTLIVDRVQANMLRSREVNSNRERKLQALQKYTDVSDEELNRRSVFLGIVYEGLTTVLKVAQRENVASREQQQFSTFPVLYQSFINGLLMTKQQLTHINSIKADINQLKVYKVPELLHKLLHILYENQIYVFQILLRVFVIKTVAEERQKYQEQIEVVKGKYYFSRAFLESEEQRPAEETEMASNLGFTKRQKVRNKLIIKEIRDIAQFYKFQIQVQRSEGYPLCQMKALTHLLRSKLTENIFTYLIQKCKLIKYCVPVQNGGKNKNQFSPLVLIAPKKELAVKKLSMCKLKGLSVLPNESRIAAKANQQTNKQNYMAEVIVGKQQKQRDEMQKGEQQKIDQLANKCTAVKETIKIQEIGKSSKLDFEQVVPIKAKANEQMCFKRLFNKQGYAAKPESFIRQKMQKNCITQRFQNKPLLMFKKHRKSNRQALSRRDQQQRQLQQQIRMSVRSVNFYMKNNSQQQQGCLAEQTPTHRKRTYLHYYPN